MIPAQCAQLTIFPVRIAASSATMKGQHGTTLFRLASDRSMNDLRFKLFKLRLLLIVAFLALVGLALRLHELIR